MMRSFGLRHALTLAASLFLLVPLPSLAWGGLGHRTVAAIAVALLPPAKVAKMNALLSQLEIDGNAVDAASYPDEWIRDHDNSKDNWHFTDIPDGSGPQALKDCTDCLYQALPQMLAALKTGSGGQDQAVALAWVIHLLGDMHQPLHMEARLRGGNDFPVAYRGKKTCRNSYAKGATKVELHSVWDVCLVEELSFDKIGHSHDPSGLAKALLGDIQSYQGRAELAAATDPLWLDWGDASHQLAQQIAFGSLQSGDDLEDSYIGDKNFAADTKSALATVQRQLLTAGIRLAMLIDQNFSV